LIFAFFLRTVHLSTNPVALNQDEAVNGYDAFVLGKTLMDHHGNFLPPMLESFEDWASPLLTYVTVPFVLLFGLSLKTIRIVVVLMGVGSIGLFYIFLRQIKMREKTALLGAFLLAIMPWHIIYSRWAIPPSSVCFALFLFLVTFLWVYKKKYLLLYILPGLAAIALTYSYPTRSYLYHC
jgi:4-amino-4-deoxy-L-arabinose transferase-like glycosyltransferase